MGSQVSIIIPALNEAEGLALAVERAWSGNPCDVIVVDGGSDDGTFALAESLPCRALQSRRGRAAQQNLGAQHATGDVLLFLHADNWLAPCGVEQIQQGLADGKASSGAFRQRIEASGAMFRLIERGNAFRARRLNRPYGDQGIFVRRALFEQVGGFPNVALMEDVLLMRALRKFGRPLLLPGPLYVSARRWRRHGLVRQTLRNWTLLTAAGLGVSPDRLAKFYRPHK